MSAADIEGDIWLAGRVAQWRRLVNAGHRVRFLDFLGLDEGEYVRWVRTGEVPDRLKTERRQRR